VQGSCVWEETGVDTRLFVVYALLTYTSIRGRMRSSLNALILALPFYRTRHVKNIA
jgi:hypothetical protein